MVGILGGATLDTPTRVFPATTTTSDNFDVCVSHKPTSTLTFEAQTLPFLSHINSKAKCQLSKSGQRSNPGSAKDRIRVHKLLRNDAGDPNHLETTQTRA